MRFLVAVPVYNEAKHVAGVLGEVRRHANDVLVVDDGSSDATPGILARIPWIQSLRHPENRGYGQSLIDSFRYAVERCYDWVITIDCDAQHEPAGIPAFVERAMTGDVDVVSGSRYLAQVPGSTAAPPDRRAINARITQLLNCMLGLSLTDAFCGFKAYRVEAVARLRLTVPGYAFPMQFWVQAAAASLRVCELPVALIYNDPTRHFGGLLDDPDTRLAHYLSVLRAELENMRSSTQVVGRTPSALVDALGACREAV